MSSELEEILKRVAAGELDPERALALIDAVQPPGDAVQSGASTAGPATTAAGATGSTTTDPGGTRPSSEPAAVWGTPSGAPPGRPGAAETPAAGASAGSPGTATDGEGPVTGLRVRAAYQSIDVFADPAVAGAYATGAHTARREGGLLVVESPDLPPADPERGRPEAGGWFAFSGLGSLGALARPFPWNRSAFQVQIRVNPLLPLELDLSGCSLRIFGGEAGAQVRLLASSMKADRLRGPLVIEAMTSSVKGEVVPSGQSRITAEQSSVRLALLAGTDLRIRATNRMSTVVLADQTSPGSHRLRHADTLEHVIGAGRDQLDLEAVMSSVVLAVPHS